MLDPAPTTKLDPTLTRGTLSEVHPATATKPGYVVLTLPNTDYKLHLHPVDGNTEAFAGMVGQRVIGTVRVEAKRIDRVGAGGRYVEPCFGRPRRVQGMVRTVMGDSVVVGAGNGLAIHLVPTAPGQSAGQFAEDDFVTCGVKDNATFELAV